MKIRVRRSREIGRQVLPIILFGLVISATLSASASGAILPGKGIAGVNIGASMARVRAQLGRPDRVTPPSWRYGPPLRGRVGFDHRHEVNDVSTRSPRQRTHKGIGPGSSLGALHAAYPHAHCHARKRRRSICILSAHDDGRTVKTDFIFNGPLREVDVYSIPPAVPPGPK